MKDVVPSVVVSFIESEFRWIVNSDGAAQRLEAAKRHDPGLKAALIKIVGNIPDELIQISQHDYVDLIKAICQLETRVSGKWGTLNSFEMEAIKTIHRFLLRCPDRATEKEVNDFLFVRDEELRKLLQIDLSEINKSLRSGHWKSATVLAGSVIEALLLAIMHLTTPAATMSSGAQPTVGLAFRPLAG